MADLERVTEESARAGLSWTAEAYGVRIDQLSLEKDVNGVRSASTPNAIGRYIPYDLGFAATGNLVVKLMSKRGRPEAAQLQKLGNCMVEKGDDCVLRVEHPDSWPRAAGSSGLRFGEKRLLPASLVQVVEQDGKTAEVYFGYDENNPNHYGFLINALKVGTVHKESGPYYSEDSTIRTVVENYEYYDQADVAPCFLPFPGTP